MSFIYAERLWLVKQCLFKEKKYFMIKSFLAPMSFRNKSAEKMTSVIALNVGDRSMLTCGRLRWYADVDYSE